MTLEDLKKFINKYVDVTNSDGGGASGWVTEVVEEDGVPWVVFDYGYGYPVEDEESITEVDPPADDPGMFKG